MTTLVDVTKRKPAVQSAEQRSCGVGEGAGLSLTGPDGLLKQLTKTVLDAALNEEMTEHLGHETRPAGRRGLGRYSQWHQG